MRKLHVFIYILVGLLGNGLFAAKPSRGASAEDTALLQQIQEQVMTLRDEFKQRIARSKEDQQAVYENLQQKLKELMEMQQSYLESQPDIVKKVEELHPVLEEYGLQIDRIDAMFTAMEAEMTKNLDALSTEFKDIRQHGRRHPSSNAGQSASPRQNAGATDEPSPLDQLGEGELFRLAYQFYRDREYDVAIGGFQKFLTDYPTSQLAGAAQYWIAESFNNLEEYQIAIEEYSRLLATYPGSDKTADAYYGIGVAQARLGNVEDAKTQFQYVIRQYPGTIAAQKAQRRLDEF